MPQPLAVTRPGLVDGDRKFGAPVLLDGQLAVPVRSLVVVGGGNMPSARNCRGWPIWGIVGLPGYTVIDCRGTHDTVSCVWPIIPWYSAEMIVVPQFWALTM